MGKNTPSSFLSAFVFALITLKLSLVWALPDSRRPSSSDIDVVDFALNLEFLEAEFFLNGALGLGLDSINSSLAQGGPPPIGAQKANLSPLVKRIIEEFGYQEVGHIRAIVGKTGGIKRPLLNLSSQGFARALDLAVGYKLSPPFDPYDNTINYLLASYFLPYIGLGGYVGAIPNLTSAAYRSLVASLLGVESGQDAVIRTLLYQRANEVVFPYGITVERFTTLISNLRNNLGMAGLKDEGIMVPLALGAENRTTSNVLSADTFSLSYPRTVPEILRIVYGTGNESRPGGFYPNGANGNIARMFLGSPA